MQTWEYWVKELAISEKWSPKKQAEELERFRETLNTAGQNGWELVSYQAIPVVGSWSSNIKSYAYLAVFKRPTS